MRREDYPCSLPGYFNHLVQLFSVIFAVAPLTRSTYRHSPDPELQLLVSNYQDILIGRLVILFEE